MLRQRPPSAHAPSSPRPSTATWSGGASSAQEEPCPQACLASLLPQLLLQHHHVHHHLHHHSPQTRTTQSHHLLVVAMALPLLRPRALALASLPRQRLRWIRHPPLALVVLLVLRLVPVVLALAVRAFGLAPGRYSKRISRLVLETAALLLVLASPPLTLALLAPPLPRQRLR